VLPVVRFVGQHVLTLRTPIGRKARPKFIHSSPLIRVRRQDLAADGVERLPRLAGMKDGLPILEDGRVMHVTNVVWCTGFRQDFGWIDLPIFAEDGAPDHVRGVVDSAPGLYFVGLNFQFSATSDVLPSRGRDVEEILRPARRECGRRELEVFGGRRDHPPRDARRMGRHRVVERRVRHPGEHAAGERSADSGRASQRHAAP
jgi:hypothetical protein